MISSALTQKNLKSVFDEAIRAVLFPPAKKQPKKRGGFSLNINFGGGGKEKEKEKEKEKDKEDEVPVAPTEPKKPVSFRDEEILKCSFCSSLYF